MQIVGHRGWPTVEHSENTLDALDAALQAGADGVEVDVRLTRDGVAVCCHDSELTRLAGLHALVAELTWDELRGVVLVSGHSMPTLQQVVRLVAGRGQLVLDLKLDTRPAALAEATLRDVRGVDDVVISSFYDSVLDAAAVLSPALSRARLVDPDEPVGSALASARDRGDDAVHLPIRTVLTDPDAVRAARGLLIRAWTVNRLVDVRLCEALGFAAVITDEPARFAAARITA